MRSNYFYYLKIISFIIFNYLTFANAQHHPKVETLIASTVATIVGSESEQCTAGDCNDRGSCFGTKAVPLCLCQLGFAGPRCLETYCDPMRECSARGWCMGTATQFTCFCNIGFSGDRCQHETPTPTVLTLKPTQSTPEEGKSNHHHHHDDNSIETFHAHNHESERENEHENDHDENEEEHDHMHIHHHARHPRNINAV